MRLRIVWLSVVLFFTMGFGALAKPVEKPNPLILEQVREAIPIVAKRLDCEEKAIEELIAFNRKSCEKLPKGEQWHGRIEHMIVEVAQLAEKNPAFGEKAEHSDEGLFYLTRHRFIKLLLTAKKDLHFPGKLLNVVEPYVYFSQARSICAVERSSFVTRLDMWIAIAENKPNMTPSQVYEFYRKEIGEGYVVFPEEMSDFLAEIEAEESK